jgi:hypothetical protein
MDTSRLGGPQHRAEIVRIFNSVEDDKKRRLTFLAGQFENIFSAVICLGRDEGNDPLMIAAGDQSVKGRQRLDMDRDVLGLGLINEISELPIGPLNEKTLERTAPCT